MVTSLAHSACAACALNADACTARCHLGAMQLTTSLDRCSDRQRPAHGRSRSSQRACVRATAKQHGQDVKRGRLCRKLHWGGHHNATPVPACPGGARPTTALRSNDGSGGSCQYGVGLDGTHPLVNLLAELRSYTYTVKNPSEGRMPSWQHTSVSKSS